MTECKHPVSLRRERTTIGGPYIECTACGKEVPGDYTSGKYHPEKPFLQSIRHPFRAFAHWRNRRWAARLDRDLAKSFMKAFRRR